MKKAIVYLADLTHTKKGIASECIPMPIGLIGAYLIKKLDQNVDVSLFKYPEKLDRALSIRKPNIMAFSCYMWNIRLSYAFIKQVKTAYPATVSVLGGPNYPLDVEEQKQFFSSYP